MPSAQRSKDFADRFVKGIVKDEAQQNEFRKRVQEAFDSPRPVEYFCDLKIGDHPHLSFPTAKVSLKEACHLPQTVETATVLNVRIKLGKQHFSKRLMREYGSNRFLTVRMREDEYEKVKVFEYLGHLWARYSFPANPRKRAMNRKQLKPYGEEALEVGDDISLFEEEERWHRTVAVNFFAVSGDHAFPRVSIVQLYRSQINGDDIIFDLIEKNKLLRRIQLCRSQGCICDYQLSDRTFVHYKDTFDAAGEFSFSDGCSVMTYALAKKLFKQCPLFQNNEIPAVTQFRLPGVKGVIGVLQSETRIGVHREDKSLKLCTGEFTADTSPNYEVYQSATAEKLFISDSSQVKFTATTAKCNWKFEILNDSVSMFDIARNEQVVAHEVFLVLEALLRTGVSLGAYKRFLIRQKEIAFEQTEKDFRENFEFHIQHKLQTEKPLENLISGLECLNREYLGYRKAMQFPFFPNFKLQKAYKALVFVDFDRKMPRGHLIAKFGGKFMTGKCCLFRLPCNLPNDIQTFQAMSENQVKLFWGGEFPSYLLDNCIVVSGIPGTDSRSQRPVMNLLSGGDFDGDTCYVVFQKELVDLIENTDRKEPLELRATEDRLKELETPVVVQQTHRQPRVSNFYLDLAIKNEGRFMVESGSRITATSKAWYSIADKFGAKSKEAMLLGLAYQKALDGQLSEETMKKIFASVAESRPHEFKTWLNHSMQWRLCRFKGHYSYEVDAKSLLSRFMQSLCNQSQEMCRSMLLNQNIRLEIDKLFDVCELEIDDVNISKEIVEARGLWKLIVGGLETEDASKKKLHVMIDTYLNKNVASIHERYRLEKEEKERKELEEKERLEKEKQRQEQEEREKEEQERLERMRQASNTTTASSPPYYNNQGKGKGKGKGKNWKRQSNSYHGFNGAKRPRWN